MSNRRKELDEICKDLDENDKKLLDPLLDEIVDLENQLSYLRTLPQIRVNPKDKSMQKKTEAAKLRKECSQSYMNAIRIVAAQLNKVESTAKDELLQKLEEFQ